MALVIVVVGRIRPALAAQSGWARRDSLAVHHAAIPGVVVFDRPLLPCVQVKVVKVAGVQTPAVHVPGVEVQTLRPVQVPLLLLQGLLRRVLRLRSTRARCCVQLLCEFWPCERLHVPAFVAATQRIVAREAASARRRAAALGIVGLRCCTFRTSYRCSAMSCRPRCSSRGPRTGIASCRSCCCRRLR